MKVGLYSIRDEKTGFMSVTTDLNDFSASRNFESAIMRGTGVMGTHAKDFDLFKVGEFDTETGIIESATIPKITISGNSVKLKVGEPSNEV